jgi:hypothetical protein
MEELSGSDIQQSYRSTAACAYGHFKSREDFNNDLCPFIFRAGSFAEARRRRWLKIHHIAIHRLMVTLFVARLW